jgi:hypothetical protein
MEMKTIIIVQDPAGKEEIPKLFCGDLVEHYKINQGDIFIMRIPADGPGVNCLVLCIEYTETHPTVLEEVKTVVMERMATH